MAGIITRDLSVSGEGNNKHLILRNGSMSRGLAIGSNWSELGICMRYRFNTVASIGGSPELVLGVGYGLSGWASPVNALGMVLSAATFTYNASKYVGAGATLGRMRVKRGSSIIQTTDQGGGNTTYTATTDTTRLSTLLLSIVKATGTGDWVMKWVHNTNGAAPTSTADLEDHIYALEQGNWSGFYTHLATTLSQNMTYSAISNMLMPNTTIAEATYGYLDSIFVHWNRNDPPLEIADIVVAKWA